MHEFRPSNWCRQPYDFGPLISVQQTQYCCLSSSSYYDEAVPQQDNVLRHWTHIVQDLFQEHTDIRDILSCLITRFYSDLAFVERG